MTLSEYEQHALVEIKTWEKRGHRGFHKKFLDLISKPIGFIVDGVGHDRLKALEAAIATAIDRLLNASTYTVELDELVERAHSHGMMIKNVSELRACDLQVLDKCNRESINFHKRAATIQGAVAGLGGGLVATADITAVLIQDFHLIQEIAFCYAFDPGTPIEKQIVLRIIEGAIGASNIKRKALEEIEILSQLERAGDQNIIAEKNVSIVGSKALEEVAEHLAARFVVMLVPRTLPVISVAVSAHSNRELIEHSGEMAFMVYRKRFVERKMAL